MSLFVRLLLFVCVLPTLTVFCASLLDPEYEGLHQAAKAGKTLNLKNEIEVLAYSHKLSTALSAVDENGLALLHIVCAANNVEGAALLIRAGSGVDILTKDSHELSPLMISSQNGFSKLVKLLIEQKADLKTRSASGQTGLSFAAQYGRSKVVKILLKAGADIHTRSSTGATPLHYACSRGFDAVVKRLLHAGAEINIKDNQNLTPLMMAANKSRKKVVNEFVTRVVLPNTPKFTEENALYNKKYLELLLETDHKGETALYMAAQAGDQSTVWLLCSYFIQVVDRESLLKLLNMASVVGRTPLWIAANKGNASVVELLLSLGANLGIKSNSGKSVEDVASEHAHVTKVLQEHAKKEARKQQKTAAKVAESETASGKLEL